MPICARSIDARFAWTPGSSTPCTHGPREIPTPAVRPRPPARRAWAKPAARWGARFANSCSACRQCVSPGVVKMNPTRKKNKPPFSEACYELMNQVLDEALALDPSASDIDPLLDKLSAEVEQARREFEERVADHDIASDPQRVP